MLAMSSALERARPCPRTIASSSLSPSAPTPSRCSFSRGRSCGADQYAPETLAAATAALQQSNQAVEQRDYRLALSLAVDAGDRAQEATRAAAANKAKTRTDTETALNSTNASLMQLQARVKAAEGVRVPARDLSPARITLKDAEATLQKARALLAAEDYAAAKAAVSGLEAQIRSEIKVVEAATTLRTARRPARKR
jgi:uncharacterized protein DUF4398